MAVHGVEFIVACCDLGAGIVEVTLILIEGLSPCVDLYALFSVKVGRPNCEAVAL